MRPRWAPWAPLKIRHQKLGGRSARWHYERSGYNR